MDSTFQHNLIHWLELDNKITELNSELKKCRDKRLAKESLITDYISSKNLEDKSITIPSYNSNIKYVESQSYDNLSFKYLNECLTEYFDDTTTDVPNILKFIKNKRLKKSKIVLKRDIIRNTSIS